MALLDIEGLTVRFRTLRGEVHAVNGVTLSVDEGETVALVGESGSGKSVTALAVLGLLAPTATIAAGSIRSAGRELVGLPGAKMREVRGRAISMVFQDPMTSLNPLMTIGAQIREVLDAHTDLRGRAAKQRVVELIEQVGIPDAERRSFQYPHQFSGGMRQRAMIAVAIACKPRLLIADEPTTALDVTMQAQILGLLASLIAEYRMGLLLITHDLGVVAGTCETTNVMYGGRIVETGTTREIFRSPTHPYTRGLLGSIPTMGGERKVKLTAIDGQPPVLRSTPQGCTFEARCANRIERCVVEVPSLDPVGDDTGSMVHAAACFNPWPSARDGGVA